MTIRGYVFHYIHETQILKSYSIHGISTADAFINTHDMRLLVLWGVSRWHAISTAAVWDWLLGVCEQVGGSQYVNDPLSCPPTGARIRTGGWAGCASPERCTKLWNICCGLHQRHTDMVRITSKKQKTNDTLRIYSPTLGLFLLSLRLYRCISLHHGHVILSQES